MNGIAAGIDPSIVQGAAAIENVINMSYERDDELDSDELGVQIMIDPGYKPNELISVMRILKDVSSPNKNYRKNECPFRS